MHFTDFVLGFVKEDNPRGDLARDLQIDIKENRCKCKTYEGLRSRLIKLQASQGALKALYECHELFERKSKKLYKFEDKLSN